MIRLEFNKELPALGMIGEWGDEIAIIINEWLVVCSTTQQRTDLFNMLTRAIEKRGTIIDLDEIREVREVRRYLASVQTPTKKVCHGVDTSPPQR